MSNPYGESQKMFWEWNISFERMLGLDVFFAHNAIVTLIGFLIYKEWLL